MTDNYFQSEGRREKALQDTVKVLHEVHEAARHHDQATALAAILEINRLTGLDGPEPESAEIAAALELKAQVRAIEGNLAVAAREARDFDDNITVLAIRSREQADRITAVERLLGLGGVDVEIAEERSVPPVVDEVFGITTEDSVPIPGDPNGHHMVEVSIGKWPSPFPTMPIPKGKSCSP